MHMFHLLSKRDTGQSISISVHALLCRESIPMIKWISEMLDASVTVVSSTDDKVNPNDFLFLRNKFPKHLVYYDMHHSSVVGKEDMEHPQQVAAQLQKLQHTRFRTDQWRVIPGFEEKVYMSSEAVVIQAGIVAYGEDPYVYTNEPMIIRGRLTMFNMPIKRDLRKDIGVTITLHDKLNSELNSIEGIRCFIGLDGLLKLSTKVKRENDIVPLTAETTNEQSSGCYNFEIHEMVGRKILMNVQHAHSCDTTSYFHSYATSNSTVELDVSDIEYIHKYITISSSNPYGYVAIEILKVN